MLAKTSVRELWVMYFSKLMESLAYYITALVMVLYFSSNLGMSDIEAGNVFGIWASALGLLMLFAGPLCDVIGIRLSLILGFLFCLASRFLFTFIPSYYIILFLALPFLAIGMPLLIPIKTAAIKQYTSKKSRAVAFGVFYSMLNVAFLIAGILFDEIAAFVRRIGTPAGETVFKRGREVTKYVITIFGQEITSYQMIFFVASCLTVLGLLAVIFLVRKRSYAEEDIEAFNRQQNKRNPLKNLWSTFKDQNYWRFMLFLGILTLVKLLMTHNQITVPKFMLREIGQEAAIGKVFAINGFMLMVLPPIVSVFVKRFHAYSTIVVGALIAALSPVFLVFNYDSYIPIATQVGLHPVYIPVILYIVVYSIGEAIFSPRVYEYTANIAPKGQESTYASLSMLPWTLAKMPAGFISGWLLTAYSPAEGARNPQMMWLIIFLMTLLAPVLLVVLKRFVLPADVEERLAPSKTEESGGLGLNIPQGSKPAAVRVK